MRVLWIGGLIVVSAVGLLADRAAADQLSEDFRNPPFLTHSRPLWFWNGKLDAQKTRKIMDQCKAAGYCGLGILPTGEMGVGFMTPEFLNQYAVAVEHAARLGMKLCLYDEFWFPSGSAGGLLGKKYPEALGKRLDMRATEVRGPKEFTESLPPGVLMGAVAMETGTKKRQDISASVKEEKLVWQVPAGEWKVMLFSCVPDGARGLVDYLSPEAVEKYIELTYQAYYDRFAADFGTTIDSAFYDEPTFHWIEGGRAWTEKFNERFRQRYHEDPVLLYPALWMDIGPETAAARNSLLGFRAELYSTGFPKTINDWCHKHRVRLTGHVDQEEIVNPVGLCGDLMKAFAHQDMPGIDQVFQYGRASRAYKVVSSAAVNYDRTQVMVECYGAIDNMPVANLYKEAMDQFAKGINTMVPHAVWYDPAKIIFRPDLSPGAAVYGPELPAYNEFIGRLQGMLQGGRHVVDIGVLYPIATLQSGYHFGVGKPYEGGVIPPEADYMDLGETLALVLRRDFTFVHPEVFAARCKVEGNAIVLNNAVHHQQYRVFFVPGCRTIGVENLRQIKRFFDGGGQVIATTRLPDTSAESGHDAEVGQLVASIFGDRLPSSAGGYNTNVAGGRAWFLPSPSPATVKGVLDTALSCPDVAIEGDPKVVGGSLSYIHKVKDGHDLYFFANSSDGPLDLWVRLRGRLALEAWNPHDGTIATSESTKMDDKAGPVTRARLKLLPARCLFLVTGK